MATSVGLPVSVATPLPSSRAVTDCDIFAARQRRNEPTRRYCQGLLWVVSRLSGFGRGSPKADIQHAIWPSQLVLPVIGACRLPYGNLSLLLRQYPQTGNSLIGPRPTFDASSNRGSAATEFASQFCVTRTFPSELRYRHARPQGQHTAPSAQLGHR